MQWYYAKGGEQAGPVDDKDFHELARTGQITPETPVWREGMANWTPYGQVSGRTPPAATRKKLTLARDAGTEAEGGAHAAGSAGATAAGATVAAVHSPQSSGACNVTGLMSPLYRGKGWIRFAGILGIISGIVQVLSIWGIVLAWIPIWMGILLTNAAKYIAIAHDSNDDQAGQLALDKLRLYFKLIGVLTIVGIVLGIVAGIVVIIGIAGIGLPMLGGGLLRH